MNAKITTGSFMAAALLSLGVAQAADSKTTQPAKKPAPQQPAATAPAKPSAVQPTALAPQRPGPGAPAASPAAPAAPGANPANADRENCTATSDTGMMGCPG